MIKLPNGCTCSKPVVYPTTWKTRKSSMDVKWHINYRFYDPSGKVKQVMLRGMNRLTDWKDRVNETDYTLSKVESDLFKGYNPFTGKFFEAFDYEISPDAPFFFALESAYPKIKCSPKTLGCIKSMLNCSKASAQRVNIHDLPVNQIKRRHLVRFLDQCKIDRQLSPGNYNHYRSYLRMMFKVLVKLETVEYNPVSEEIEKEQVVKKKRQLLTLEERQIIDTFLKQNHYNYWRYLHIFFHSGARSTEMCQLQGKKVDLEKQCFTVTVLKGGQGKEVSKPIKDVVLPLWKEVLLNCKPEDFVFTEGFVPGKKSVLPEMASRHWKRIVKGLDTTNSKAKNKRLSTPGLGITANWYELKHLASDETARLLSIEHAMKQNSHTSTSTTKIYAINHLEREQEQIKKLGNKFS